MRSCPRRWRALFHASRAHLASVSSAPPPAEARSEGPARLARRQRSRVWRTVLLMAGLLGPGFITASAGNDVGGIATYSSAGAQYGYKLLWTLIPITVALIVVQEMAARMG